MAMESPEPSRTSHFMKCAKSSTTNWPPKVAIRPCWTKDRMTPTTTRARIAIHDTDRVAPSPR